MKNFYRKATTKEMKVFKEKPCPIQDKIFEVVSIYEDKIYLTDGTALSRFYFNHRLSEDLDFFTTTDDLKLIANDLITRLKDRDFSIEIDRLDIYFARFFAEKDNCRLKIDFVKEYNLYGNLIKTEKGIYVNNLEDIGTNKITAFEDRAEIKDIIDLYYITKNIPLERLFEIANIKRMPISYENLLAINTVGISGRILILKDVDEEELFSFVRKLKNRTEEEIEKKENMATGDIQDLIYRLLWDFPCEDRNINEYSIPVLKRRLHKLPLPERRIMEKCLH